MKPLNFIVVVSLLIFGTYLCTSDGVDPKVATAVVAFEAFDISYDNVKTKYLIYTFRLL